MGYTELKTQQEILQARNLIDSWKDENIPLRQYQIAVEPELKKDWLQVPPFKAFKEVVDYIEYLDDNSGKNVLEVGSSSGYYGELLRRWNIDWDYTGLDYNPKFGELSNKLWPKQKFVEGDALNLQFEDKSFDIVVSGCCMLHILDYKKAISETARISKKFVVFHRHPLLWDTYTRFFLKEAYGVPCFEIWFNADEFKTDLKNNGLEIIYTAQVFERDTEYGKYGHYSILCRKK